MKYLIICLTLAACVTNYPDSPKLRECTWEAKKETAGRNFYGARGVIDGAISEVMAYNEIRDACMAR
jgi:hypothetical protein